MEVNTELRDQIFQIISNQMRLNNPPETKIAYERLMQVGYNQFEAKQLIDNALQLNYLTY